jgi:hypothetical protein
MDAVFMIMVNTMCLSQLQDKTGLYFWCGGGGGGGADKHSTYVMAVVEMVVGN